MQVDTDCASVHTPQRTSLGAPHDAPPVLSTAGAAAPPVANCRRGSQAGARTQSPGAAADAAVLLPRAS